MKEKKTTFMVNENEKENHISKRGKKISKSWWLAAMVVNETAKKNGFIILELFFWKWNSKQKELLKQTYANYKLIIYNWIVFFYFFICIFSVFLVLLFMIQTLQLYQKIQIPCIHTKQDLRWWQIINVLPTVPERERERDERFHLFVPTTALISSGIEKKLLAHLIDHYGCLDLWWWWFSFLSFFFLFASLIQWQFTF